MNIKKPAMTAGRLFRRAEVGRSLLSQINQRLIRSQQHVFRQRCRRIGVVAEQQAIARRARERCFCHFAVEVRQDQQRCRVILAAVGKDLRMLGKKLAVIAVLDDALRFAQLNQRAVVGVDAPRVACRRASVDFPAVRIHAQPQRAAGESRLRARRPLHRRACVVAAARPQQFVNGRRVPPRRASLSTTTP